ncbi:hypothetical protein QOZ80_6AG0540550 [Eleusine coracana subsp. coracana]|nr:hypothetical protein QOZ80_6AG0540550 [Eleusine coracana subsp. coracana]
MQKGPGQVLHESHGINLCFQNSSVPFQMDSSIDPGAGNVTPPVTFEKAYANSQAVRDGAVAAEGVETNGKSVQKPKRKKHRPKVIKEVQSAKSQKPKTPNPPKEKGNQHTGKRKYVRRKGLNPPATQPPTGGTDIQTRAEPGATQRCLNFDREDTHGNTDLVSQIQVTQMPTVSENHLTSISGVERSSTQVSCHWGGTNSSFSSVDPMADSCELRVDSMPKRAAFDLNNSVINQMPISYSNLMESSDQFLHYDSRGRVQNNQLLDFHPGTPVSFTYLNSSVNQMQNNLANLDQYIGASQSSTEQSPRHDQLVHLIRMFENQAAPAQRSERVSVRDAFNPEACLREGAMINQMAQCYRPQDSIFAPPRHIERDAMSGDMNEFSAKNDDLKCATNSNYRIGAGFEFGGSPDFSDVLATSKKREHNAINGHTISFGMDFDNTNKTRLFYNDHLSTSSQTSYFPETCKRMRSDNLSSQLNSAMGNFSSSSVCSGSWNTNKVSAIKPGACTLADVQRLMAREKSRASQRMIDLGISENNMAQLHAKPDLQNIVDKNCFALHGREYGSFTGQHIQSPGCTMNPLGESTIPRNGAYQPQSCEIRPSQHHSSDSISLPAKWCTYVSTAHTQLPNSTENPSMENYIQGNDIHQLHSLENIAVDKSVLFSEPHKTSTQDDTVNYYSTAASSDAQVRTTNAEIVKPFSQPPRDGNCHPESSRLTTEAKSSEKPKVRGRPRKDAKTNGTPEDRNSTGKKNVGRAKKRVSSKGASSEFLKTDSITCASEPSTATIPRMIITESEKYGETTLNVLKASDRDNYCDTSKQAHKGFNSQDTTPSVDPLDAIIQKIKILSINRPDAVAAEIPQNALVPYEGGYGALVPFERKVKKSRSRAKVNIDPVTTLMWNLLMGPDMSDGAEGLDKDKEKWLEEERRVFRGRVDSFIARMHLVQGDRRFSPWKGSVVDSVVGVFLTQNVSDHLSSSAFMAVAAKFPAKSEVPEEHVADISHTPHQGQNDSCPGLFGDSTKLQGKLSVEEISDIRSLITTDDNEESNSNELIGSSSGCGANHVAEGCPDSCRKSLNGSHENGPAGSVFPTTGFSCGVEAEDGSLEDVISSQNSAVSSHISPDHLFHITDPLGSSSVQNFTEDACIIRNISNGIGISSEYTEIPSMQDPKNIANGNAGSSEYHGGSRLPVSGVNKGLFLDLNRSYQPVHSSIYVQNGQSDFTGVSCFNYMDQSFYTGSDRVNLSSVTQSEASQAASSMDNISKTKLTNPPSHLLYRISGSVSQDGTPFPSVSSQQGDFSPIIKQNLQPVISPEDLSFSKKRTFCETHLSRNKADTSSVELHSHSELQEAYTTTTKQTRGELQSGCTELNGDVRVQATEYGKHCSLNLCENQNPHSNVLQGVSSGSAQKFTDIQKGPLEIPTDGSKAAKVRGRPKKKTYDWDSLRKEVLSKCGDKPRSHNAKDTVDWEAVRQADVRKISETIRERGMNNMLAERIKEFLNRLVRDHGSVDLEWLRDVQPDKAKDYLLSIRGLGLKSVECVRLLTLHHMAFPVDTNVGRICVRLGWVPLQPLPESLQLHLLEMYPMLEQIQKYLWPRLCKLDQRTLYELHYQMITFGKVFCSKSKPNCNSCPMRAECKHFASAFASARLALPGPQEKSLVTSEDPNATGFCHQTYTDSRTVGQLEWNANHPRHAIPGNHQPIIEEPPSPEPEAENAETNEDAIEDFCYEDPDEIPRIDLNIEQFTQNLKSYMQANNLEIEQADMSKALVAITPAAASIPTPKLKNVSRLRTEHHVYELPDEHPLLEGLEPREQDDPSPYLLSIWTPGETAQSTDAPMTFCNSEETGKLCGTSTCFNCNNIRETQAQKVRGTLLIPCRTAMRGSFPLNGTYFQVNEVFADHDSSQNPIDVPRSLIWNLPRRTVYFGTSVPTIFRGLTTQEIQQCFWRGFVCVRGFDRTVRAPRPLYARFHFPASKVARGKKPGASKEEE